MDYRALAKRAKETSRRDKEEAVKKKDGSTVMVCKFKRKKRFGKSLLKHAPGQFNERLERKCAKYGVEVINVDTTKCKASQLDHTTGAYIKMQLSDRKKVVGGHTVQRDLYSAFLLYCCRNGIEADLTLALKIFDDFLAKQEDAVWEYLLDGHISRNFGMTLDDLAA